MYEITSTTGILSCHRFVTFYTSKRLTDNQSTGVLAQAEHANLAAIWAHIAEAISYLFQTLRNVCIRLLWLVTLLFSLLLLGCNGGGNKFVDGVKLPQKVAGTSDKEALKLQKMLTRCGVKIITVGQDYLVSIPSSALFPDQSPQLTWKSYGLLNKVVQFLKQFRKVGVNVTGYSSSYVSARREHALTLARARAVANYLWSQGIDSRFIFTQGLGSDKPITAYTQGGDGSPNSRIEITFRDAII